MAQLAQALHPALLLFVLLGTTQCRLRDTSGYCQCEKRCPLESGEQVCVATNDPQYGCASKTTCDACYLSNANFLNATATCDRDGECALGGCKTGFADCNGDPLDGCEIHYTSDAAHCGRCYSPCPGADLHAESVCDSGLCTIERCLPGFQDCNHWYVDGCETGPDAGCDATAADTAPDE